MSARRRTKGKVVNQSTDWSAWEWDEPNFQWYRGRFGTDGKQHWILLQTLSPLQATTNLRLQEIMSMNTVPLRRYPEAKKATQLESLLLHGLLVLLTRHQHTTKMTLPTLRIFNRVIMMLVPFRKPSGGQILPQMKGQDRLVLHPTITVLVESEVSNNLYVHQL